MLDKIYFKDGEVKLDLTVHDENNKLKLITKTLQDNEILGYLDMNVELSEDFTLRDYFHLINNNKVLQYLDPWFQSYIPHFDKIKYNVFRKNTDSEKIKYIELTRMYELNESSIEEAGDLLNDAKYDEKHKGYVMDFSNVTYNDNKSITSYINVSGLSDDDDNTNYCLSMTPVDDLLDCVLIISKDSVVSVNDTKNSNYSNSRYEDDQGISLYEFIKSVIFELSFFGDEEDKEATLNDLKMRAYEIKDNLDDEDIDN